MPSSTVIPSNAERWSPRCPTMTVGFVSSSILIEPHDVGAPAPTPLGACRSNLRRTDPGSRLSVVVRYFLSS
ncbi:MAG: hypothetical protein R3C01_03795 [Planctomycetaceae bacterium]